MNTAQLFSIFKLIYSYSHAWLALSNQHIIIHFNFLFSLQLKCPQTYLSRLNQCESKHHEFKFPLIRNWHHRLPSSFMMVTSQMLTGPRTQPSSSFSTLSLAKKNSSGSHSKSSTISIQISLRVSFFLNSTSPLKGL